MRRPLYWQLFKMYKNRISAIYLLPNSFTLAAMFCGFYAIVQSINRDFIDSGIAVFIAVVLDSLDGRVARLTRTSSSFGAQLDSLSDLVNFGVAPAIIAFSWELYKLNKLGWLFAFIYCSCTALRLARFNTMLNVIDNKYFVGLASPPAAILVVGFVYICTKYNISFNGLSLLMSTIVLIAALSMVNNVRFYSFKQFGLYKNHRFVMLLIMIVLLSVLVIAPGITIYVIVAAYVIASYVAIPLKMGFYSRYRR